MPGFTGWKHQAVLTQKRIKAVSAGHETAAEKHGEHDPQLVTADARVLNAYLADGIQYQAFSFQAGLNDTVHLRGQGTADFVVDKRELLDAEPGQPFPALNNADVAALQALGNTVYQLEEGDGPCIYASTRQGIG